MCSGKDSVPRELKTLRRFPENNPLEYLGMDLITKPHLSVRGHTKIPVISTSTKFLRVLPMKDTKGFQIAQAFAKYWDFVYEIPKSMVTDNGTPLASKFL